MKKSHRNVLGLPLFSFVALFFLGGAAHGALTITPTYVNSAGETWDSDRLGVFEKAIADWESVLDAPASEGSVNINVTVDFTNAGTSGYLGQWSGSWDGVFVGDDTRPWQKTTHTIHFNADLFSGANYTWWDPSPDDGSDQPFAAWDALSVARHEIGHMLGFNSSLYRDEIGTGSEVNVWTTHITTAGSVATFDSGGLNVTMASTTNLSHVDDSGVTTDDLMNPQLVNGQRRAISEADLAMLALAYDYQVIPEPGVGVILLVSLGMGALRRKRN